MKVQVWSIVCFVRDKNGNLWQVDSSRPYVTYTFCDKELAIRVAKRMRKIGLEEGRKYHFIVQGNELDLCGFKTTDHIDREEILI